MTQLFRFLLAALSLGALSIAQSWSAETKYNHTKTTSYGTVERARVQFASGTTALPASEREQIMQVVDQLRKANYCPLHGITILGYSDAREGSPAKRMALASERARYVARLLELAGMPKELILGEGSAEHQVVAKDSSESNIRVEVNADVGCQFCDMCMIPVGADGFRTLK